MHIKTNIPSQKNQILFEKAMEAGDIDTAIKILGEYEENTNATEQIYDLFYDKPPEPLKVLYEKARLNGCVESMISYHALIEERKN